MGHEGELDYADTLQWLHDQVSDEGARARILGENAYRFYFAEREAL